MTEICIVGAGLAGSMMATALSSLPANITVYEKRADPRQGQQSANFDSVLGQLTDSSKRSINLALSNRGLNALRKFGLAEKVLCDAVPMKGRFIHKPDGSSELQPYGVFGECIYSVSRGALNELMLDAATQNTKVSVAFNTNFVQVDANGEVTVEGGNGKTKKKFDLVIGADGSFSKVRQCMSRLCRLNHGVEYIKHGYKELTIPPTSQGDFALNPPNALHIWPRHDFMLIALPNADRSFTVTLFCPWVGKNGFDHLTSPQVVTEFFKANFPDVLPLIPTLMEDFFVNPASGLLTCRVDPFHCGPIVLIGDAAHAAVPFYGLGMNCAFEDCMVLDGLLRQYDIPTALSTYSEQRVVAAHALQSLSLDNYHTMSSRTVSTFWLLRQKSHRLLHRILGNRWRTQYSMVSFSDIPFHKIIEMERKQDQILAWGVGTLTTAALAAFIYTLASKRQ